MLPWGSFVYSLSAVPFKLESLDYVHSALLKYSYPSNCFTGCHTQTWLEQQIIS